jgi:formate hydrogenlyase subunit 3/multisubunit Na+/H+ antiporter MnhD subunit
MSGVMVKLGIYGLIRVTTLIGPPPLWWGCVLAVIGITGALFAISQAIYQRDIKRALAYSSIENIGLIAFALGLAYIAADHGFPVMAALAMTAGLLHVWNHSLMKGSMFLAVGNIVHATHTRDMERLGGLASRMPLTALCMIAGAVALSAFPPLNGFVSEWLLYQGLIGQGIGAHSAVWMVALLLIGLLALVGALAGLAFVRMCGICLLGQPRSASAQAGYERSAGMIIPVFVLLAGCVAIALLPEFFVSAFSQVTGELFGAPAPIDAALPELGRFNLLLCGVLAAITLSYGLLRRLRPLSRGATWDCGYAAPSPRMQYSAHSFAELFVETVLPRSVRARIKRTPPGGLFPGESRLATECVDPLTRAVYEPAFARWAGRLSSLHWVQRGVLHLYLLYVLVAVLVGLAWVSLGDLSGR